MEGYGHVVWETKGYLSLNVQDYYHINMGNGCDAKMVNVEGHNFQNKDTYL